LFLVKIAIELNCAAKILTSKIFFLTNLTVLG